MNQSGQTITLGLWAVGAGGVFALLSALIGWLGVAVTGSDTSSNALLGALDRATTQGCRRPCLRPRTARAGCSAR